MDSELLVRGSLEADIEIKDQGSEKTKFFNRAKCLNLLGSTAIVPGPKKAPMIPKVPSPTI